MSTDVVTRIRQGEGRFWGSIKRMARMALGIHVPVDGPTRLMWKVLYRVHVAMRNSIIWSKRFFWFEPLFRSQCESVGRSFRMQQLPFIQGSGRIVIGDHVWMAGKSGIAFCNQRRQRPELVIGDDTFIGHNCGFFVNRSIRIGKHCLIAANVYIRDHDGHPIDAQMRREKMPSQVVRPVEIGDDVWIGMNVQILKGVKIGDRAIIGTGAVVTDDVPSDTVVAGNPAKVVKQLKCEISAGDKK